MKVGIYKIGKPIYFKNNEDDHASWSIEVVAIAQLMSDYGHDVYILSETDYDGHDFKIGMPSDLDRVYVWNGKSDNLDWEIVFTVCKDVRLIVTDMALIPENLSKFSKVYTQSKRLHTYGGIELASLYRSEPSTDFEKDVTFYFGGTERGRTRDFLDYVYRPDQLWYGKSDSLGIKNYIPFHEHIELLKRTKYTIVIGDRNYNFNGFVTPRYYECLQFGVLPFVDSKFDPDNLIPVHPFLWVKNYIDMRRKIAYLEACPVERDKILKEAIELIPQEYISGETLYNYLID